MNGKRILLVIAGGIAAYKSLELIRRLRERGAEVRCILTRAGAEFVTPLSVSTLAEGRVHGDLFEVGAEDGIGHIRLAREADVAVVAPATADLMAKMATGLADDLASATLLARAGPVLIAPAMHTEMWQHPATRRNLARLEADGVRRVGPTSGELASGDVGEGRMAEPAEILAAIEDMLAGASARGRSLDGRRAIVTSGPTHEPIDPVRYIANRSSGKQGHAIAGALARLGAETVLISGPSHEPDPAGVEIVRIETARQMLAACQSHLPADVAVCAAAVSDWRVATERSAKLKKNGGGAPTLDMVENPDILASLSGDNKARPALVVGFAAETHDLLANAAEKRTAKGCDWIVANDVSAGSGTFGGEANTVHLLTADGTEDWPRLTKVEVAERLARRIAEHFDGGAAKS